MSFLPCEEAPRPGACPTKLKPPSGVCTSDTDECIFDGDCEGETKKCCSNNCFKECVEPAVRVAIRGKYIVVNDVIVPLLIVYNPSAGPDSARDFLAPFRLTASGPAWMSKTITDSPRNNRLHSYEVFRI